MTERNRKCMPVVIQPQTSAEANHKQTLILMPFADAACVTVYHAGRIRNLQVEFQPNDLTFYPLHRHACEAGKPLLACQHLHEAQALSDLISTQ